MYEIRTNWIELDWRQQPKTNPGFVNMAKRKAILNTLSDFTYQETKIKGLVLIIKIIKKILQLTTDKVAKHLTDMYPPLIQALI